MARNGLVGSSQQAALMVAALVSALALAAAFVSQYAFGMRPCELCLLQRYPYAAVLLLGVFDLVFRRQSSIVTMLAWGAGLILLGEAALALYHVGVERHIVASFTGCASAGAAGTLEEMRQQIMEAPLVPCDQAGWEWLGLSMAGWNALAAFAFGLAVLASVTEPPRRAR